MGDVLNADIERATTSVVLVAPMVDLYSKEIGRGFLNNLGRGRNTGLQPPLTILLPWQVFTHLSKLRCKYGGCCECKDKKNKEKLFTISISSEACARKIWHPMRIGKSYLGRWCSQDSCLSQHTDHNFLLYQNTNVLPHSGYIDTIRT